MLHHVCRAVIILLARWPVEVEIMRIKVDIHIAYFCSVSRSLFAPFELNKLSRWNIAMVQDVRQWLSCLEPDIVLLVEHSIGSLESYCCLRWFHPFYL